jgi:Spy/CpxP family protein refolding chaperone
MEKMRETHKAMMDETDQNIKAVLTAEQAQKYDKMREEHKTSMEKKMKEHQDKEDKGEGK